MYFSGVWEPAELRRARGAHRPAMLSNVMADKELADAARLLSRVASRLSSTPTSTVANTPTSHVESSPSSNSNQNRGGNHDQPSCSSRPGTGRVVDAASELRNLLTHHFQGRRYDRQ